MYDTLYANPSHGFLQNRTSKRSKWGDLSEKTASVEMQTLHLWRCKACICGDAPKS